MYKFTLEKGSKKYVCPTCSVKKFVRYVKRSTDEHLDSDVGRCDRESKCGYHFTPKMYFAENPQSENTQILHTKAKRISEQGTIRTNGSRTKETARNQIKTFDFIPNDYLLKTLGNYEQNAFAEYLLNLFPDCCDEIQITLKKYFVGTFRNYYGAYTCFPYIDLRKRICKAKLIRFNQATGNRLKGEYDTSSLSAKLKLGNKYKQCFFGEHLIRDNPNKTVCIVEAEKTAVIASICYPEFVWLAIGSKQSLKFDRIKQIGRTRKIILYPDADGFDVWNKTAQTARTNGFDVTISNLINIYASDKERSNGFDLADYLISEQTGINEQNKFIDSVNEKLEIVNNDAKLFKQFNKILDEQIATLVIYKQTPEVEAETIISNPQNVRSIVMSL